MSDKQKDAPKVSPTQTDKPTPKPASPQQPSHDPKVVVTATKSVKPGDLQKRGK
jgi:hypothetical protein